MNSVEHFIAILANWAWGPASVIMLIGSGIFLTIRLGFIQFRYSNKAFTMLGASSDDPEQTSGFQALATVLSGTIGTGNVAGVATAVVAGGSGALFWMWMTALFGMATKFSSSLLANKYREVNPHTGEITGGPMVVMAKALNWPKLGLMFSIFCIFTALSTGSLVQTNSIVDAIAYVLPSVNYHRGVIGVIVMAATAIVVMGGIKRLAHVATILVPFMAIFYCSASLVIIIAHYKQVPHILFSVFNNALKFTSVSGAVLGNAIRSGVSRGLMSSEAGLGTAPITMATVNVKNPSEAGLIGMIGPIFDTLIVCSMTGLVLLLSNFENLNVRLNGSGLIAFAFEKGLGNINSSLAVLGPWVVAIGLFLFAYTTILTWSYLGGRAAKYISPRYGVPVYQFLFLVAVFAGSVIPLDTVWHLADISNIGMALPNVLATIVLSGQVVKTWRDYKK